MSTSTVKSFFLNFYFNFYSWGSIFVGSQFFPDRGDVILLVESWDNFNRFKTNACGNENSSARVIHESQEHWFPTNDDSSVFKYSTIARSRRSSTKISFVDSITTKKKSKLFIFFLNAAVYVLGMNFHGKFHSIPKMFHRVPI